MKKFTLILTTLLILCAALFMSVTAFAESYKATVRESSIKMYSKMSASDTNKIAVISQGSTVTVTSTSGDWAKISYNGKTGYVKNAGLKFKEFSGYAKSIVPLYSRATSSSTELGRITVATRLQVVGISGDFYKVKTRTGSHEGYIRISNVVTSSPECPTDIAYTNADSVPVYKKPTSSSEKWRTLSQNYQLKIVGEVDNYYAVTRMNDVWVGYIAKSKLSKSKTSTTSSTTAAPSRFEEKTGYAARIAPLYNHASTSADMTYITVATRLNITGESGDFYKVTTRTGSHSGYIKKSDVSSTVPACPTEIAYVNANGTPSYKKASSSAAKWGTYGLNTKLKIVGESGSFYAVTEMDDVLVGYIAKDKMSKTRVSGTSTTPAPTTTKFKEKTAYAAKIIPFYSSASSTSEQYRITVATRMQLVGESGDYYRVITRTGAHEGYVKKSDIISSVPACPTEIAYVNANNVTAYKKASSSSGVWGTFNVNAQLKIVGESGDYYAVTQMNDVTVGYILKTKMSKSRVSATATPKPTSGVTSAPTSAPTASPTPVPGERGTYSSSTSSTTMPSSLKSKQTTYSGSLTNAQKIEYAIYYAQDRLGFYYATKPNNTTTYDCLTLCYYAYSKVGYHIPSSSYACGYSGSQQFIYSQSDLKRGDIVCFDTIEDSDSSDHVGIYLGNNYFIHCSSGAGMVVVSYMGSGFYKEHFFCGRRIINT